MVNVADILYVAGAWAFWGTYPVPFKSPAALRANTDPFVFQCMKSICVCLTSWIILTWKDFSFTYWGFVGALLWVPSGILFITAVKLTGVAFTAPVANGTQVLVAFLWGIFYFDNKVRNAGLAALALSMMICAMTGISFSVNYEKIREAREAKRALQASENEKTPLVPNDKIDPRAKDKAAEMRRTVLGLICALCVGLFGGSMNVPLKNAPKDAHGIQYVISFGIGAVAVTAVMTTIYVIARYFMGLGAPTVNLRLSIIPGTLAGCLWAAGNIMQLYVTLSIGQAIGYPIVQCNMFIAGCWGVFYYNEAPRIQMKILFLVSCAVLLGGVTLLSLYG